MPLPFPDPIDVSIVRWPQEAPVRQRLADLHRPRLLVVAPGAEPPDTVDHLEDWLREPVDPVDLVARVRTLQQRAVGLTEEPVLDDDGLLRVGDAWVAITDAQLGVVRLLLQRFGAVVRTEDIVAAYVAHGGSGHLASIKTVIARLAARFDEVGLSLTSIRARGVVLTYRVHYGV